MTALLPISCLASIPPLCAANVDGDVQKHMTAREGGGGAQGSPPWLRSLPSWQRSDTPPSMVTWPQHTSHTAPATKCGGCARTVSTATSTPGKPECVTGSTRSMAIPPVLAGSPASATPWQPRIPRPSSSSGTLCATKTGQRSCCLRAPGRYIGAAPCTAHLSCGQPGPTISMHPTGCPACARPRQGVFKPRQVGSSQRKLRSRGRGILWSRL